ncbi:MAG: SDR family oxidoreductase [Rhodospirillaceae bacterium]
MNTLFCFGLGYSAMALARRLDTQGWRIAGTCRAPARRAALGALGIGASLFDGSAPMDRPDLLDGATHLLASIPPDAEGDPVLRHHADTLAGSGSLEWVGYLSTTGVYGNRGGDWVDEGSELRPGSDRSRRRAAAEAAWLDWGAKNGVPVQVFRLAGIYGPGRSVAAQIKDGTARRIVKPGHLFSRIHVEDIATVLAASIARPEPGGIYNVCDDEPAAQADVIAYACELLGFPPPPAVPFEDAATEMSPMARSFWADNRRVRNDRIRDVLGVELAFPDYRAGLRAILGG